MSKLETLRTCAMSPKTKAGGGSKGRDPKDSWLRRSLKKVTAPVKQPAAPTTQTPRSPRRPNPLALLPTPRGFDGPQTDRPDGVNDGLIGTSLARR